MCACLCQFACLEVCVFRVTTIPVEVVRASPASSPLSLSLFFHTLRQKVGNGKSQFAVGFKVLCVCVFVCIYVCVCVCVSRSVH
jgi:hypothetical protein